MTRRLAQLAPKPAKPAAKRPAHKPSEPDTAQRALIQTKLTVGPAGDSFEAEADRVAAHVVSGAYGPPPAISSVGTAGASASRKEAPKKAKPPDERIQKKASDTTPAAKPKPQDKIQRKPLDVPKAGTKDDKKPPIQRAVVPSPERLEEQVAQLAPAGPVSAAGGPAPAAVEAGIAQAHQGGGRPLAPDVRGPMERGFGRDFSGVRVHAGSAASGLSRDLGARAFTTGSDVFFGAGEYRPQTHDGQRLLAHELAHVVQQTEGGPLAQPKRIQRADPITPAKPEVKPETKAAEDAEKKAEEPPKVWTDPKKKDRAIDLTDPANPVYKLPSLDLPRMLNTAKGDRSNKTIAGQQKEGLCAIQTDQPFVWTSKGQRKKESEDVEGGDAQVGLWQAALKGALQPPLQTSFGARGEDIVDKQTGEKIHYLRLAKGKTARGSPVLFVGTTEELGKHDQIMRPKWDRIGNYADMEVDHFHEIQLGGRHSIENFWLLEREKNGESGTTIKGTFLGALNALTADAKEKEFFAGANASANLGVLKSYPENIRVEFAKVSAKKDFNVEKLYWTFADITAGKHLPSLQPLSAKEMKEEGLVFDPNATLNTINLFLGKDSAFRRRMTVKGTELKPVGREKDDFVSGFNLATTEYIKPTVVTDDAPLGKLTGYAFGNRTVEAQLPGGKKEKVKLITSKPIPMPILSHTRYGYGGYLDRTVINAALMGPDVIRIAGASPITVQEASIRDDFVMYARGTIGPEKPLLAGMQIPIRMEGDAVFIDFPLPVDQLKFGPFKVTQSSLQIGVNKNGLFLGGAADFVVETVGKGHVEARNLDLCGKFIFDFEAFTPAEVDVAYKDDAWSITGKLGVKEGILPGVKSGDIQVTADSNSFGMVGTVVISAPGVPEGTTITVGYTPEQGLVIGGEVPLNTDRIPGVTGARMAVLLKRRPDSTWSVSGIGTGQFALPGVTGSLTVSWMDGILTISGTGVIKRDPMTGSVTFFVTNQPVGDDGQPIAGPPLANFRASGAGIVTIAFGKFLTGTAGIRVMENGEIEITGKIALPPEIPIIPEKKLPLPGGIEFPELRFPIIGLTVPVINKSFGVFGFVRGGITLSATVGPGLLKDTEVDVTYNPDRPEEAHIHGGSRFVITAEGKIALEVTGGIGAGLAIIEAKGEVGISAGIGLQLAGGASVDIDWTPVQGLALDASVFGEARPKFTIDLIAKASVVADLGWLGEYDIWSDSWNKNLGSFGPDLAVSARLPGSWSEANGLNLDLANLEFKYPDIDVTDLAKSIFEAVV